jgi:hypothetical protein
MGHIHSFKSKSITSRGVDEETVPWKSLGTSMNAISFGFVATAILISMFLIMAIFEHLFKPTPQSLLATSQESVPSGKHGNTHTVSLFIIYVVLFNKYSKKVEILFAVGDYFLIAI